MHVAVLVEQLYAPVPGGSGRYTADLLSGLAENRPDGAALVRWAARHRNGTPNAGSDGDRHLPLDRRSLALAWSLGIGPSPQAVDVVHAPTLLVPPRRGAAARRTDGGGGYLP